MELNLTADLDISLNYISNDELIFRTENLVQIERKIMHLVLSHILEIMNRRLYADLGYDSMYSMMIKKYGYSEASALRRIDAAKLLKSVPDVADRLKSGALKLSQACLLQKCIESGAKKGEITSVTKTQEILKTLEACNGFETRQVLAKEFDMPLKIQDIVRPQKDESVRIEVTFTKEQFEELKQAKSFLSHVVYNGSWAEVITALASKLNQTKIGKQSKSTDRSKSAKCFFEQGKTAPTAVKNEDPKVVPNKFPNHGQCEAGFALSQKTPSGSATELKNVQSLDSPTLNPPRQKDSFDELSLLTSSVEPVQRKREPISVHIKRELFAKAKGCCQYVTPSG